MAYAVLQENLFGRRVEMINRYTAEREIMLCFRQTGEVDCSENCPVIFKGSSLMFIRLLREPDPERHDYVFECGHHLDEEK